MNDTMTKFPDDLDELRSLINTMSDSQIPESFTVKDLQQILQASQKILITSSDISKYAEHDLNISRLLSDELSNLVTASKLRQYTDSTTTAIRQITEEINNFRSLKRGTDLKKASKKTLSCIKSFSEKLENTMMELSRILKDLERLLSNLQALDFRLSKYILAGEIKIYQVNTIFNDFDNGDHSRIKTTNDRYYIEQCLNGFERRISTIKENQLVCGQSIAIVKNYLIKIREILDSVDRILYTTIPAFKAEYSLK